MYTYTFQKFGVSKNFFFKKLILLFCKEIQFAFFIIIFYLFFILH